LADIVSLKFNSEGQADGTPSRQGGSLSGEPGTQDHAGMKAPMLVTIPGQRVFLCELSMASIPLRTTWAIVSRLRLKRTAYGRR